MARRLQSMDELFKGRHFEREIIVLCARWYRRFKLSLRDLVEMMAERGLALAHTTIMRWVQRFVPEFEKRWNRFARKAGRSWRVDETYVKIRGRWSEDKVEHIKATEALEAANGLRAVVLVGMVYCDDQYDPPFPFARAFLLAHDDLPLALTCARYSASACVIR